MHNKKLLANSVSSFLLGKINFKNIFVKSYPQIFKKIKRVQLKRAGKKIFARRSRARGKK